MAFTVPNIPGVTTRDDSPMASKPARPHVAAAIVFNSKGQLYVRSENGSHWYLMGARNFGLSCECTAAQFGRSCRHIKGDTRTGAKGAAAFLESLDPAHLKGAQLAFYWDTVQDPARKAIRTRRTQPVELSSLFK